MSWKSRGAESNSKSVVSRKLSLLLCIGCFCAGMLFTDRMWTVPEAKGISRRMGNQDERLNLVLEGCDPRINDEKKEPKDILGEVSKTHHAIQTLDKTISNLEMELAAARAVQDSILGGSPISRDLKITEPTKRRKYLMVIGINTAFSSRKRRDSIRATWMPQGDKRKKLEEEKGIIVRFVIVLHIIPLILPCFYFFGPTAATLGTTLARHRSKSRVYIGCMKSGPVLAQKGVRYHEPEYWKFGEEGNKYFRHATGQLYAISKDLATYVSINQHVLHKYANEDVSLGSWFIGLDVEHIDDRRLCCGTPPDCEWKAQAGNICVASFDWSCSGICKSAERIKEVHRRCGEGENALWGAVF
ncbi:Beta-1,3-galactosyltransferase [Actinidia chinensis var. chinensis]|uniref:Hexosyltransferase n=1 Tax=Actinidia chinensis var. chinensis TaxID=1590841 RepID=A0A2R6PRB4_ACTCC|nr:Beta-1,3-galactosyltransferase [Actinidia chinensis var. chinensis]